MNRQKQLHSGEGKDNHQLLVRAGNVYLLQMKVKSWLVMMNNFDFGGNKYERWRPGLVEKRNSQAKFELIIWKIMHLLGRCGNYDALNGKTNATKYMYQDILEKKKKTCDPFLQDFSLTDWFHFFFKTTTPLSIMLDQHKKTWQEIVITVYADLLSQQA